MFSALDINNNLVDIDRAVKEPLNKYFCTFCKRELVVKNGNIRISHFAHKNSNLTQVNPSFGNSPGEQLFTITKQ